MKSTLPGALRAAAESHGEKVFLHCQSESGPAAEPATRACPPIRATRRWRLAWTIWRPPC